MHHLSYRNEFHLHVNKTQYDTFNMNGCEVYLASITRHNATLKWPVFNSFSPLYTIFIYIYIYIHTHIYTYMYGKEIVY